MLFGRISNSFSIQLDAKKNNFKSPQLSIEIFVKVAIALKLEKNQCVLYNSFLNFHFCEY
jgi:hypothetical protein